MRALMPIACRPVVQAVTTARLGPFMPNMIDRLPEIMLMMVPGMKKGEILRGPPARKSLCVSSIIGRPPMPGADVDADAVGIGLGDFDAGVADGLNARSHAVMDEHIHAARFLGRQVGGHVEVLHLAGDAGGEGLASKRVIGPMPLLPAIRFSQASEQYCRPARSRPDR
jgi:hypothetical protein